MVKCKLFEKIGYWADDEYSEFKNRLGNESDWVEVTDEDYLALKEMTEKTCNYMLFREIEYREFKLILLDCLAKYHKEKEEAEKRKLKYQKATLDRAKKREETKKKRDLKKLEKLKAQYDTK